MAGMLVTVGLALALVGLTIAAIVKMQRDLDKPGGRDHLGGLGDAFGNLIDVFDPGQSRARVDLKHEEHRGPVTPSPDDHDPGPVRLVAGPDGRPRAVRIRRPR